MMYHSTCAGANTEFTFAHTTHNAHNPPNNATHLLAELGGFDLHKSCLNCFHEAFLVAKRHTTGANRILVPVCIYASIDHAPKQIIHDVSKNICGKRKEEEVRSSCCNACPQMRSAAAHSY